MKFYMNDKTGLILSEPKYDIEEQSFFFDPSLESDFTLMLGCSYLGLNIFLKSRMLVSFSGYCPKHLWHEEILQPPQRVVSGMVVIECNDTLISGAGIYLFEQTNLFYDKNSNWCCVKALNNIQADVNIEFAPNCVISLSGGNFVALWFKLIYA